MSEEIVSVTQQLLDAVAAGDYATYEQLSDDTLTCIEPETNGNIIEGVRRATGSPESSPAHPTV